MTQIQFVFTLIAGCLLAVVAMANFGTSGEDCRREPGVPYRWTACIVDDR